MKTLKIMSLLLLLSLLTGCATYVGVVEYPVYYSPRPVIIYPHHGYYHHHWHH